MVFKSASLELISTSDDILLTATSGNILTESLTSIVMLGGATTSQYFTIMDDNPLPIFTVYADGSVNINEAYTLPTADGTNGQVLTTNGSGAVSWSNGSGFWTDEGSYLKATEKDIRVYDDTEYVRLYDANSSPDYFILDTSTRNLKISASGSYDLWLYAGDDITLEPIGGDANIILGDKAGSKGLVIYDSDEVQVAKIDSDGKAIFNSPGAANSITIWHDGSRGRIKTSHDNLVFDIPDSKYCYWWFDDTYRVTFSDKRFVIS